MVVQGILALALALPTGLLFGVGYGTGVRIGYEQVYPLLFPKDSQNRNVTPTVDNIKQINGIYNAIGGKEASQMGIAMGLQGAMEELDRNPDFQALEALELRLYGRTQSRLGKEEVLKPTSISDFPLGSSLDPNSPNFDAEYYIFVKKKQLDNEQTPASTEVQDALDEAERQRKLKAKQEADEAAARQKILDDQKSKLAAQPSTISVLIWAGYPNRAKSEIPSYGVVRKYLTTLIKKSNRAARVNSLTLTGKNLRASHVPLATGESYWHASLYGMSKYFKNNETLIFVIPYGY